MTAMIRSRSSSLFSLSTSVSSRTSFPPSPTFDLSEKDPITTAIEVTSESHPQGSRPLQWRPLLFSTASTTSRSTHLHFTAFPPQDLTKPTFELISMETALALLQEEISSTSLSFLALPTSKVSPVSHIPIPASLPANLRHHLKSSVEWSYFHVTDTMVPLGVRNLSTRYNHHVAVRYLADGVERYIFAPGGLAIHSVCRVEDAGTEEIERIPRETLYLREETEILCNKAMKWWVQSMIENKIATSHESLRCAWDSRVREDWSFVKARKEGDWSL